MFGGAASDVIARGSWVTNNFREDSDGGLNRTHENIPPTYDAYSIIRTWYTLLLQMKYLYKPHSWEMCMIHVVSLGIVLLAPSDSGHVQRTLSTFHPGGGVLCRCN